MAKATAAESVAVLPTGIQVAPEESIEARLQAKNLGMVTLAEVQDLFQDPRYETEQVVFVDARSRRYYEEGHLPGAFHLDHFYPEETLAEVLPAALMAEVVMVYCNGGD